MRDDANGGFRPDLPRNIVLCGGTGCAARRIRGLICGQRALLCFPAHVADRSSALQEYTGSRIYMDELGSRATPPLRSARPSIPLRLFELLLSIWHEPDGRVLQRRIFFVGCLLSICGITALIGAVPTREYGHDIFVMLESAWRTINGQRPHVDYVSPFGPVMFLVFGLGLRLSHYTVDGVGYSNAIVGLLIGLWSYRISRVRMESSPRMLSGLFLAALVVAPYALGSSPLTSSHAMVYNRYGYALLGLVMLESFQPVGGARSRGENWLGGFSSGAAAALLLFLKASFFFVSLLLIGASILFWSRARHRLLGLTIGFLLVTLAFLAYLTFDVRAIISDLQMVASARSQSISAYGLFLLAARNMAYLVGALLLAFAASPAVAAARPRWLELRLLGLGAFAFIVDILARSTNAQRDAMPMIAVFAIIVMNTITAHHRNLPEAEARVTRPYYGAMLALAGLLLLPQWTSDLTGLAYGAWKKARPPNLAKVVRFTEPRLAPLLLYDGAESERSNGSVFTTYVNDGVSLLRRVSAPGETIINMDMTNPFPYALNRKPPLGGMIAPGYKYTLSDTHHPSDDAYFGKADIVMVPKHPALDDVFYVGYLRIYEPALHERFRLAGETEWWRLYRRK